MRNSGARHHTTAPAIKARQNIHIIVVGFCSSTRWNLQACQVSAAAKDRTVPPIYEISPTGSSLCLFPSIAVLPFSAAAAMAAPPPHSLVDSGGDANNPTTSPSIADAIAIAAQDAEVPVVSMRLPLADPMRAYRACLNCRRRKSKCDLDANNGRPVSVYSVLRFFWSGT